MVRAIFSRCGIWFCKINKGVQKMGCSWRAWRGNGMAGGSEEGRELGYGRGWDGLLCFLSHLSFSLDTELATAICHQTSPLLVESYTNAHSPQFNLKPNSRAYLISFSFSQRTRGRCSSLLDRGSSHTSRGATAGVERRPIPACDGYIVSFGPTNRSAWITIAVCCHGFPKVLHRTATHPSSDCPNDDASPHPVSAAWLIGEMSGNS